MSYSIREAVQDTESNLLAKRAIAEVYPDATLRSLTKDRQGWCSDRVGENATDVELIWDGSNVVVYLYVEVQGTRVYATPYPITHGVLLLDTLRRRYPTVYSDLVRVVREG